MVVEPPALLLGCLAAAAAAALLLLLQRWVTVQGVLVESSLPTVTCCLR
jgi:hypothetical protein